LSALGALAMGATFAYASHDPDDVIDDEPAPGEEIVDVDNSGPGGGNDQDDTSDGDFDDSAGDEANTDDAADAADDDRSENSGPGGSEDDGDNGADDSDSGNSGSNDQDDAGGGDDSDDNSDSGKEEGGGSGSNSGSGDDDDGDGDEDDNSGSGGGTGSGDDDDDDDDDNSGSSGGSGSGDDNSNSGSNSGSSHSGSGSSVSGDDLAANANEKSGPPSLESDEADEKYVAGEALLTGALSDIETARAAGFIPISTTHLDSLDCEVARLALPEGMNVAQAVAALQALAPNAIVSPNHAYHRSQGSIARVARSANSESSALVGTLGIIDTGVARQDLSRPDALISQRAFAGEAPTPRDHGGAVAALAVDLGMRVQVADVFTASATGEEFASAERLAAGLDWLIQSRIPVINISIEGPENPMLRALVRRASERGHVIVAAAGNGGPLAQPAFPAAFDGAVAVTAIDSYDRPYARANRGQYIDYAAHGVNIRVAAGDDMLVVSGTSFAAPVVAARIAAHLQAPSPEGARAALNDLQAHAVDLGDPGHDPIFGWGAVRR
jgi:hypothetical protein